MINAILRFTLFWGINVLLLWLAAEVFSGVSYTDLQTLAIAGLLFGVVNATVKPVLVLLTFPITLVTLGLFLLVINALMLLLVAWLVPGFHIAGFWYAVLVSLFIWVFGFVLNLLFGVRR